MKYSAYRDRKTQWDCSRDYTSTDAPKPVQKAGKTAVPCSTPHPFFIPCTQQPGLQKDVGQCIPFSNIQHP